MLAGPKKNFLFSKNYRIFLYSVNFALVLRFLVLKIFSYVCTFLYSILAATPPSGRLFLLVPVESFIGPSALIIKIELSYDRCMLQHRDPLTIDQI